MALLGNLTGSSQYFNDYRVYNGVATQSLRLDNSASSLLTRTPSAGNRKTWTWSAWIKRGDIGRDQDFFTAEGSGGQLYAIMVTDGDQLQIYAASAVLLLSNQLLRDTSAWYHIVVKSDTTQGTASDRLKIYLNGSEVTSFATDNRGSYAQNTDYGINSNVKHNIGSNQAGGNFGDYYIAEVNFVDGTAYDASYFGETKNGVWIPKKYTGSYGTQGFRLEFKQTGDGSSTASSSTIGADTSGNGNHYKDTNLDAHDSNMPDSPENNFATMNPINKSTSMPYFSEGNLKLAPNAGNYNMAFSNMGVSSGKFYYEFGISGTTNTGDEHGIIDLAGIDYSNNNTTNVGTKGYSYYPNNGNKTGIGSSSSYGNSYTNDDIISVALDMDAGKVWFAKNGTYQASGNPATGANEAFSSLAGTYFAAATLYAGGFSAVIFNFGQDSSFAGTETAQGNTDANGIGDFYYTPPSGFLALCTSNLPEPTISPNSATQADDYFNTVLYTGNGSNDHSITGVGFQPDWIWFKKRSGSQSHSLFDSTRGTDLRLQSDTDSADASTTTQLESFDSDGFTVNTNANVNGSSATYVAWNWKANGGTTSSNSDGSITSTVQANTTSGFSIVTYNGEGDGQATVGHGLGVKPQVIIPKNRGAGGNWHMYHEGIDSSAPEDYGILLNSTNVRADDAGFHNDTAPTSSVFTVGTYNNFDYDYVAYCFAEIEGYSKFGKYTGNGSTDGTFVFTGFRPAWVIYKRTDSADNWEIMDSKRSEINGRRAYLFADTNDAETTSVADRIDFLSNGFKARVNASTFNANGASYIYMAFAEAPFKYANAR